MLKLTVVDHNVSDAVVKVQWCVDKETLDCLKELQVQKPYILFAVWIGGEEFLHQLAPLDQLMDYI